MSNVQYHPIGGRKGGGPRERSSLNHSYLRHHRSNKSSNKSSKSLASRFLCLATQATRDMRIKFPGSNQHKTVSNDIVRSVGCAEYRTALLGALRLTKKGDFL